MTLDGVFTTPLRRIPTLGGEVRHGMKANDPGFAGFGEAYFSVVDPRAVKGWKRHLRMTLNLVVVVGTIRFVVRNDQSDVAAFELSPDQPDSYRRLTVGPGLWMAFGGVAAGSNMLLNLASLPHDPTEAETVSLSTFDWAWAD